MPVRQTHCLLCTRHTIYLIWATFLYARNYNFPRVFLVETFTFLVENHFLVKTFTFLVETLNFLVETLGFLVETFTFLEETLTFFPRRNPHL